MKRYFIEFEEDVLSHMWNDEKIAKHYGVSVRTAASWKKRVDGKFRVQSFMSVWKR